MLRIITELITLTAVAHSLQAEGLVLITSAYSMSGTLLSMGAGTAQPLPGMLIQQIIGLTTPQSTSYSPLTSPQA